MLEEPSGVGETALGGWRGLEPVLNLKWCVCCLSSSCVLMQKVAMTVLKTPRPACS